MGALTFFFGALPHTSPFLTVIYILLKDLLKLIGKIPFP